MRGALYGADFLKKLRVAGLIGEGVQRVVIDCKHGEFVVMYVQHVVDEKALDVVFATDGSQLTVKVVDDVAEGQPS